MYEYVKAFPAVKTERRSSHSRCKNGPGREMNNKLIMSKCCIYNEVGQLTVWTNNSSAAVIAIHYSVVNHLSAKLFYWSIKISLQLCINSHLLILTLYLRQGLAGTITLFFFQRAVRLSAGFDLMFWSKVSHAVKSEPISWFQKVRQLIPQKAASSVHLLSQTNCITNHFVS